VGQLLSVAFGNLITGNVPDRKSVCYIPIALACPSKDSVMSALLWWAVGALILTVVVCAVAWVVALLRKARTTSPTEFKAIAPRPQPMGDNLQFTVYRPRAVMPDHWYTLIAFAHLAAKRSDAPVNEPDPVEEVRRQAVRVLGERETRTYQVVTQDVTQPVPREETLTFVPDVPGIEFNPPLRGFRWTESIHREEFRFRARPDLVGETARGQLSVFLGDILLAEVSLAIPVVQLPETAGQDAPTETEHARRYRKIFASYSHKDLHVVEQIERLARALGDEYLRDWIHVRAGEEWDKRLMQLIEEADVFQLFWSRNAMESPYVHREYEHALSLDRQNFVRPTYWEEPLPSDPARNLPPEGLRRLHFQRIGPFLLSAVDNPLLPTPQPPEGARWEVGRAEIPGYEFQGPLACGAMDSIHLARDTNLGRLVVIKFEPPLRERQKDELGPEAPLRHPGIVPIRERQKDELGPEAPLRHPGIVPILAVGEVGGWRYTVTPYLEGGTLSQRLRGEAFSPRQGAEVVLSLADAVHYAHSWGVCHLNLTPTKVLFDGAGRPSVIGFHQVRLHERTIFGTQAYLAPEQAIGKATKLGPATDVYALGAIFYELLTGRPPFQAATILDTLEQVPVPPRRLQPKVPRDLETICLKCLQKEPAKRYASAAALAEDLRRFLAEEPICARPVGTPERVWRWCRRNPVTPGLTAAVVVLALLLALIAILRLLVW
jgi:hypothetical protein